MITAILLAAGQSKRLKNENKLIKLFKKKLLINYILSKTGLRSLSKRNKGFLIVQADMPNITKTTINKIILLINKSPKEIFLPRFKNRVGNPIGFKKSMIKNINKIKGDRGAKNIIKKNSTKIKFININSKSILTNFNTKKDFSS